MHLTRRAGQIPDGRPWNARCGWSCFGDACPRLNARVTRLSIKDTHGPLAADDAISSQSGGNRTCMVISPARTTSPMLCPRSQRSRCHAKACPLSDLRRDYYWRRRSLCRGLRTPRLTAPWPVIPGRKNPSLYAAVVHPRRARAGA